MTSAIAVFVCLSPPKRLALKADGHPDGFVAAIKEVVQGRRFWACQLEAIRTELTNTEMSILKLPVDREKLTQARREAFAATDAYELRHRGNDPSMKERIAADSTARQAKQLQEEHSEELFFKDYHDSLTNRVAELRRLEKFVAMRAVPRLGRE